MCRSPLVDRDGTQSSRDFARRVDATPDVAITEELPDVASAEREVYARRVGGILVIPQYFERELLHGRPSPVALYADASYFLIYQRVAGAVGRRGAHRRRRDRDRAPDRHRGRSGDRGRRAGPDAADGGAAVQSRRRLCHLCASGRLRIDPAADVADGRGAAQHLAWRRSRRGRYTAAGGRRR